MAQTEATLRAPWEDESYVIRHFVRHANACDRCKSPWKAYKQGWILCDTGLTRAYDVTQYLFMSKSTLCSTLDHEKRRRVEIEVPSDSYHTISELFRAIHDGLKEGKPIPSLKQRRFQREKEKEKTGRGGARRGKK